MSRIGTKPIEIPEGVEVTIEDTGNMGGQKVMAKGALGTLEQHLRKEIKVAISDGILTLNRSDETKRTRSLHGLYRTLIANMIEGVAKGFEKQLEMVGIGFRAELKGSDLELSAGATHPYVVTAPEGIQFEVNDRTNIVVKGLDKQLVGQVAANIRAMAKPEPYKGKGIRYVGEYVRRKAGKVAKAGEGGDD